MMKKILVMFLIGLISNIAVFAAGSGKSKQDDTAKIRAQISKLSTGENAKVSVTLKNGKKLKGYVFKVEDDSFVVTDDKTGVQTEVQYSEVKKVKGKNLSTGVTIAVGVAVVGGTLLLLGILIRKGVIRD